MSYYRLQHFPKNMGIFGGSRRKNLEGMFPRRIHGMRQ